MTQHPKLLWRDLLHRRVRFEPYILRESPPDDVYDLGFPATRLPIPSLPQADAFQG